MSKLKIYKRTWLINQKDAKLYNICLKRNIDISKYFIKVGNKYLIIKANKVKLINNIIDSNPDYKDRVQTIMRIIAVLIAILGFLFGIYKFFIEKKEDTMELSSRTLLNKTAGTKI